MSLNLKMQNAYKIEEERKWESYLKEREIKSEIK